MPRTTLTEAMHMILRQAWQRHALSNAGWIALTVTLGLVSVQASACALVKAEIYDRAANRTLEQHRFRGQRYVAGEPGHEYSLRLRNCSDRRLLAVVSVDGVNVISGETAATNQTGYVIDAGASLEIQGWRKDYERTAAFYFTDVADAYAARTGRPENVGVIGVAAFRERAVTVIAEEEPAPIAPTVRGSHSQGSGAATPSATQDAATEGRRESAQRADSGPLGTGHGRGEYSPARRVEFARDSERPDAVVAIRYDSIERLVARGVIARPRIDWRNPEPFPALTGFVPDP
jgi:hypothetical protein